MSNLRLNIELPAPVPQRVKAAQEDRIARALRDGRSYREIARALVVSTATIASVANERGLRRRPYRRRATYGAMLAARHWRVCDLRRRGLTMRQIAIRCGISLSGVRHILHRHGLGGDTRLITDRQIAQALYLRRRGLSWRQIGAAIGRAAYGQIFLRLKDADPLRERKRAEIEWARAMDARGVAPHKIAAALGVGSPTTIERWCAGGGTAVAAADLMRWRTGRSCLPWDEGSAP